MDRRGRRSLQVEIKLPYENQPFPLLFLFAVLIFGKMYDTICVLSVNFYFYKERRK